MPYNGSGTYTNPYYPTQDRDNAIPILASKFEEFFQVDLPATFGLCVTRDGQGVITTNFNFNNFRGVQLADPVSGTDAMNKQTFDDLPENNFDIGNSSNIRTQTSLEDTRALLGIGNTFYVRDEKPTGTNGGTNISGYQTRTLNTVKVNNITGASLSSNQITLPAGKYDVFARSPGLRVGDVRARLRNITDSTTELLGSNASTSAGDFVQVDSKVIGEFTITDTKVFELQLYTLQIFADRGLGDPVDDGDTEVYSEILIKKIG